MNINAHEPAPHELRVMRDRVPMNLERRAPRRERQRARRALTPDPDGLRLLTSTDGVDFARAAVGQCGGEVISARWTTSTTSPAAAPACSTPAM